jgi:hypothetical protein
MAPWTRAGYDSRVDALVDGAAVGGPGSRGPPVGSAGRHRVGQPAHATLGKGEHMKAKAGDVIEIQGRIVGIPKQYGEIVKVHGPDGTPPYTVQYSDGHETLISPGPDALIKPKG